MKYLLFGGDVAPCGEYISLINSLGTQIWGDLLPIIRGAALSCVNLETPITDGSVPIAKAGPSLKSPSTVAEVLDVFSLLGLANNHIFDYGLEGLTDTLDICASRGIDTCGAGKTRATADTPFRTKVGCTNVSIIMAAEREFNVDSKNVAGASLIDPINLTTRLRAEKSHSDLIFIVLHCGNEYFAFPRPDLRRLTHFLIEQGADAIICHHPHIPGAHEYYLEKLIVYSTGNLLFPGERGIPEWHLGYLVRFFIDENSGSIAKSDFIPFSQSVGQGGVRLLSNHSAQVFEEECAARSEVLNDEGRWLACWHDFVEKQSKNRLVRFASPVLFQGLLRIARYLPGKVALPTQRTALQKINLIRCDSHRELIIAAIEKRLDTF